MQQNIEKQFKDYNLGGKVDDGDKPVFRKDNPDLFAR
jgi:hypothetical protein